MEVFQDAVEFEVDDAEIERLVQLPTQEIEVTQEGGTDQGVSMNEESR